MKTTLERLPKSTVALTVELASDELQPFLERAAAHLSTRRPVPGFRPGKAPYAVMRSAAGDDALHREALEFAVRATLPRALAEQHITAVGAPSVDVLKLAPGNPLVYKATVAVLPAVRLGDYRSLTVQKRAVTVDDAAVERAVADLRRSRAKETRVSRPSALGDKVLVNFTGYVDQVPIEGTSGAAQPVTLGAKQYVPGFEEQLTGMRPGETKEFTVQFPKDYYQTSLAGLAVEFRATVTDVFAVELPAVDDVFAKNVGPFSSVAAMREKIRERLTEEQRLRERARYETALLNAILEASHIDELPDALVDAEVATMWSELQGSVTEHGMAFDRYLASIKKTEDDLKRDFRPQAERRIRLALISRAVAEREGIAANDGEVQKEIAETRKLYDGNAEVLRSITSPDYADYLRTSLTNKRVLEFLDALMGIEEQK